MNATKEMGETAIILKATRRHLCIKCKDFIKEEDYYLKTNEISGTKYHISCVERYPYLIDWNMERFNEILKNKNLVNC